MPTVVSNVGVGVVIQNKRNHKDLWNQGTEFSRGFSLFSLLRKLKHKKMSMYESSQN